MRRLPRPKLRIFRIVAKAIVLDQMPDHVDAEAVDTALKPEPHHIVHCRAHIAVPPIEIRLRRQECVAVILSSAAIQLPRAAAEFRQPIVRRTSVFGWIAPDVPVTFGVMARRAAFDEPAMLIRSVIRYQVKDELYSAPMRVLKQGVELGECAKDRIDVLIIGNVITEIGHRRRIDWGQPNCVDAELGQVRQTLADSGEIANAVCIAVLERSRIDLINDRRLPPRHHAPKQTRRDLMLPPSLAPSGNGPSIVFTFRYFAQNSRRLSR